MKTKILLNSKLIGRMHELWDKHQLPVDISYGRSEKGMSEVAIECEDKDSVLVDWLLEKATE